jgi:antitoxin HicB
MRYAYPYELSRQAEGGFTVTFPDVPEAITQGGTEAEAAEMAEDALVAALSFYTDSGEPLPSPSPARGRRLAHVPVLVAAKLALHDAMLAMGISNVALSRRLDVDEKIVRRLRDPLHKSRIEKIGEALRSLGKIIEVVVGDAAPALADRGPTPVARPQLLCSKRRARSRSYSSPDAVASGFHCAQEEHNRRWMTSPAGANVNRRDEPG